MPEWSIGPVSKTGEPSRVPWVRIPPSPPTTPEIVLVLGSDLPSELELHRRLVKNGRANRCLCATDPRRQSRWIGMVDRHLDG